MGTVIAPTPIRIIVIFPETPLTYLLRSLQNIYFYRLDFPTL